MLIQGNVSISPWTSRMEKSYLIDFNKYFIVFQTNTYTSFVSTLPKFISVKTGAKRGWSLSKILFSGQQNNMHFFPVTCPVTVPEILVQTEGSDYWQLIHWSMPKNLPLNLELVLCWCLLNSIADALFSVAEHFKFLFPGFSQWKQNRRNWRKWWGKGKQCWN